MPWLPDDERHLAHAIDLAARAVGLASPNPTVGCVLVSAAGEILGEGAHFFDDRDHAEIAALRQAAAMGRDVRNATAYVSLEPCTVHGRTGPCADALIHAGIRRVVAATIDPNPDVAGNGFARLTQAGVDVAIVPAASSLGRFARSLNDAFAFSIRHSRPFVSLKAALSVDGKLAPPAHLRTATEPHWLTGPAARADVQRLRHASDAILTGIGTILADNPALTERTGLPRRRPLLRVILDTDLRTPLDARLFATIPVDDVLILCAETAPQQRASDLLALGAQVLRLPTDHSGRLHLHAVLETLHAGQIRSVLVEAGSAVNGSFLSAGLVDQLTLYIAETELGPDAVSFAAGPSPFQLQTQLSGLARTTFPHGGGEDIKLTGYLHDPWSGF